MPRSAHTSALADALTYCDVTTGSTGEQVSFEVRLADIFQRYGEADIVNQAIPSLTLAVTRMQKVLCEHGLVEDKQLLHKKPFRNVFP